MVLELRVTFGGGVGGGSCQSVSGADERPTRHGGWFRGRTQPSRNATFVVNASQNEFRYYTKRTDIFSM